MLRRLTERHKKHALWILSGKQAGGIHFDGLYAMPHGDGLVRQNFRNMIYFVYDLLFDFVLGHRSLHFPNIAFTK
jgi:hypothetical protein